MDTSRRDREEALRDPVAGLTQAEAGAAAARAGRPGGALEEDLLGAIARDEIEVLFQPQYNCADDSLCGAEALVRWNHPALGQIGAGGLFAIAERADHVIPLSRHIARLALEGARDWPAALRLSINVTPAELAVAGHAEIFADLVRASGFPASRVTLEVMEQVLISDIHAARSSLTHLAAQGMAIALDDFGAGFCNFRYLKLLPLHYLKLDRSMIDGVTSDPRDLAVLRGIIAMARALDLGVIAEGVESEAQRQLVAAEGCAVYQGFLRARPMAAAAFAGIAAAMQSPVRS